jgi:hypothetical protein
MIPIVTTPTAVPIDAAHDREWWRAEAIRTRTDWSSILRQRIRVLAWVRAGRPPLAQWLRSVGGEP